MTTAFACIKRTEMKHSLNARLLAGGNNSFNQADVNLLKIVTASIQDTGHTDHCIRTGKLFNQLIGIVNISLDKLNPGQHTHTITAISRPSEHDTLVLIGCECPEKKPTEKAARTYQYNSHVTSSLLCH
jgi:hypothetical protein